MGFDPKSHSQIVQDMASTISSESPLNDFTRGSVIRTLIETAAQEDFQQYVQMLQVIRNYNLDTAEGEDLDARAKEYGLSRSTPKKHSGFVTISDSRFTKIATKIYAGLPSPIEGDTVIYVDDATLLPANNELYIGRNTSNIEGPINFTAAPVDNTAYWAITLDTALINDHGAGEEVVLAQYGNRVIQAGTEIRIPESDFNEEFLFEINQTIQLLDGEDTIENVLTTALVPGGIRVPANSIIQYVSTPFTGAAVTNPLPYVNGSDEESDQDLRDRIRDHIQALSKGTPQSIKTGIAGVLDEATNSTVVSSKIVPPVILADGPTKVYLDNGRKLEPYNASIGLETVIESATGGERFFQLKTFPLIKANLITQAPEAYELADGDTLIFKVGPLEETISFESEDFDFISNAKANEVTEAINNKSNLVEARTLTIANKVHVILWPVADSNEDFQIDAASTALSAINFATDVIQTLKLYKNDILLTKDGETASVSSSAQPYNIANAAVQTTDGDITVTSESRIVTKTVAGSDPFSKKLNEGDYLKFDSDNDTFFIKVQTIVSDTKLILEKAYPKNGGGTGDLDVWNSPRLEVSANGDIFESETVIISPTSFSNNSQVLASEVFTVLQEQINSSKSELVSNNEKVRILSEVENSSSSKMQITGGALSIDMGFSTAAALTGTLDFTANTKIVSGTGTLFLNELVEGQWIKANVDGRGAWSKVATIEDDTTLYLETDYRGDDQTSEASQKIVFGEESQGKDRDYILNKSNGQLELLTPLNAEDKLTAGSVNTRGFLDSSDELFDFSSLGVSSTLIVCVDDGFNGTVDSSAATNQFIASNLAGFDADMLNGFYIKWISGNNSEETSFINAYNATTGEITTVANFTNTILPNDICVLCQTITFTHATDFADSANATAEEVVTAMNSQLLGAKAELLDTKIRIRTSDLDKDSNIAVVNGSANALLNFVTDLSTSQISNLAFVQCENIDRDGLSVAPGFTLGPDQSLVVVLDNQPATRTFTINTKTSGEVTSTNVSNILDSALGSSYIDDDFFNNFWIFWTSGANEGSVQSIVDYTGTSGEMSLSDVYPSGGIGAVSIGDTFELVPRTSENLEAIFNNLSSTTLKLLADTETVGIAGDTLQIATKTTGTGGKVLVTGGTANSIGILIQSIVTGAPTNDMTVNSKAGLTKGLPVHLTIDAIASTGDNSAPFNTIISENLISALPSYYDGMELEILDGLNAGFKTTINSYNNVTGEIVFDDDAVNEILDDASFRIKQRLHIADIASATSPYTISFTDITGTVFDISGFITQLSATIRDINGLNFDTQQVEGIDAYKYFTGLVQKVQWTIDGLPADTENFTGIGAAGTQFEVVPPVFVRLKVTLNVITESGISLSSVTNDVSNEVLTYVNSRDVGEDVVLSEIIAAAQVVEGVFDVEINNLTSNFIIADNEQVDLDPADLVIG